LKRYLIRVENNGIYTPQDISKIKEILNYIDKNFANIRVSKSAIEFDYFAEGEDKEIRDKITYYLGKVLDFKELKPLTLEGSFELALQLYEQERFWEAHEVIEGLWRNEKDEKKKELLQSLILLCASYVHMQKGRNSVSIGIMKRAVDKMNSDIEQLGNIKIDFQSLREQILEVIKEGKPRIIDFAKTQ
jgi:hypothetical protein